MAFTDDQIRTCRHPRENSRFVLALLVSLLVLPLLLLLAAISVAFLLLPAFVLLLWAAQEALYYRMVSGSVLVSELNYPRIHHLLEEVKADLSLEKKIDVFVYDQGEFNALMVKVFQRRSIFLNSELLESGVSDDEIRWVIGRFVGYWRTQQDRGLAGLLIRVSKHVPGVNLLILPFERATIYTGDRLGLLTISGDIVSAVSAMQKLLVGRLLGYSVNPIGIVEQAGQIKGSFFAFWARVFSAYPHTITRYVDLIAFSRRAFPTQFDRFRSSNPGLPNELDHLVGRTSCVSYGKGALALAAFAAIFMLPLAAFGFWGTQALSFLGSGYGAQDAAMPDPNLADAASLNAVEPIPGDEPSSIETEAAAPAQPALDDGVDAAPVDTSDQANPDESANMADETANEQ